MRIEKLKERYQINVSFIPFPLHPETPEEGHSLETLFAGRNLDLPRMQSHMTELMQAEGLPYGDRTMTFNSRLAQELAKWVDTQIDDSNIHMLLFQAYFVEGINLSCVDNLVSIAGQAGMAPEEARKILIERNFQNAVDSDWQRSLKLGITSVPTFVINDQGVAGAQPFEVLEQLVLAGGATAR